MHKLKSCAVIIIGFVMFFCFSNLTSANTMEPKTNVDPHHVWKIHFNQKVNDSSLIGGRIRVTMPYKIKNADGTELVIDSGVAVTIELSTDKKTILVKPPVGGYTQGQVYTLHVNDSLLSATNKKLKQPTKIQFSIVRHPVIQSSNTLYDAIYEIIRNGVEGEINLSQYTDDVDEIIQTSNEVLNDTLLFYNSYSRISYSHKGIDFTFYPLNEEFQGHPNGHLLRYEELENITQQILNEIITEQMTDYEKVKAVHDYIVLNTAYDYENYINNTLPISTSQIDGVLLYGKAVCSGYAAALKHLLTELNINSIYVSGTSNAGLSHAWNKVEIDGEWYNIDVTWNDPVGNPDETKVYYDYFLISDEHLALDHNWDNSELPKAISTKYKQIPTMWED